MNKLYIYQQKKWPHFQWEKKSVAEKVSLVEMQIQLFFVRISSLGFSMQTQAILNALTEEIVKTSAIEGEHFSQKVVRSSLCRHLGIEDLSLGPINRQVEGLVEIMIDVTRNPIHQLTFEKLFDWQSALFPSGRSGLVKIAVGQFRDDHSGPMQVVSGSLNKPKIHFIAPPASELKKEMKGFLKWFNKGSDGESVIIKAAITHLWFLTLHPFEDGNGRLARVLTELVFAQASAGGPYFYSLSAQIEKDKKSYYAILEATQKGSMDITEWLLWFCQTLSRAITTAEKTHEKVLFKNYFWNSYVDQVFTDRQKKVLNRMLDGFEGKMTSSRWAALAKCSQDTAARDIQDLIHRQILKKSTSGGRSTSYDLVLVGSSK